MMLVMARRLPRYSEFPYPADCAGLVATHTHPRRLITPVEHFLGAVARNLWHRTPRQVPPALRMRVELDAGRSRSSLLL